MRFRILGPLEARAGMRLVSLRAAKQRALLGTLLLHANDAVSTDRLVDDLWGEQPPATAAKLVQGYVHALRTQLGVNTVVTRPPGYRVEVERHELDLLEFEHLTEEARASSLERAVELRRTALDLWRGPPLADVEFHGAARHEVGRLSELHLATQIDLFEAELALGRHSRLVGELEFLVAAHPYQERLRGLLMLALYRSGRQADALAAYQAIRRALSDELGLEPGQMLRELEAAILRHDEGLLVGHTPPQPSAGPSTPSVPRSPQIGELRPLTALFADIAGTTALAERLSPDDFRVLVGGCVTQMSQAVEEHGGTVQAYTGDGICAYFGVPVTHEDDPERAARSALTILEVVGDYARDIAAAWSIPDFAVRVGVNSGTVSVGEVGAGNPQVAAFGDAVNVAYHVMRAASPGTVAVGVETARRIGDRFTLEPRRAPLSMPDRSERVAVSRLLGVREARPRRLRALVGRDAEAARLRSVALDLEAGRGQALLVIGEAGAGKSRMLAELRSMLSESVVWLEGNCLSYGGLASWPFVEMLRRWLDLEAGDAEVVVQTRAAARLTPLLDGDEHALAGLARLLGIESGAEDAGRAYVAWIEALTARSPVVLATEDLHWAHTTTRQLAEELIELTDRTPLLLVATIRPDTDSEGWRFRTRVLSDFSHRATEIRLDPLAPEWMDEILATLLPGGIDDATGQELVARAEGNPLYLEELLRALLEGGGLDRRHRTWTTSLRPSALLPPALESLLVARIDRLSGSARRLAQVAAIIGREFPLRILERVAGDWTADDLAELLRAEIVREVRRYPEPVYAFRHGLVQEATLSSLTQGRRRELFGAVATALEQAESGSLDDHVEQLAHYHAQGGNTAQAIAYLERAATRADELGAGSRGDDLRARAARLASGSDAEA